MRLAALFVLPDGPYAGIPGVDLWDATRDARRYPGPLPVIAHPPCERWGRYWHGGPSSKVRKIKGDDAGCFTAALAAVRRWGGVLEHPADSYAWHAHGLFLPPRDGGWINADWQGGWTCCVDQGHYGHKARKPTWLYAVGCQLPSLTWGPSKAKLRIDAGYHSAAERRAARENGTLRRNTGISGRQRQLTPAEFRDLLIGMILARSARTIP